MEKMEFKYLSASEKKNVMQKNLQEKPTYFDMCNPFTGILIVFNMQIRLDLILLKSHFIDD